MNSAMNAASLPPRSVVERLAWREYRLTRGFWLAVLLMSIGLQFAWRWYASFWSKNAADEPVIWWTALAMPLIYLLAALGTTFSREHETGVFRHLETLPVSSFAIWLGKYIPAIAGTFLMMGLLALSALYLRAETIDVVPPRWNATAVFASGVWLAFMLIVSGLSGLCSQWVNRPLTAALLAAVQIALIWEFTRRQPPLVSLLILGVALVVTSAKCARGWRAESLGVSRGGVEDGLHDATNQRSHVRPRGRLKRD